MKKAVVFSCCFLLVSFLQSQSLVDIAKKEKERRESLKGRKAIVVTNEDIANIKKTPAIQLREPEKLEPA